MEVVVARENNLHDVLVSSNTWHTVMAVVVDDPAMVAMVVAGCRRSVLLLTT